mmetsp:Transcript_19185/g.34738  ORF Transcript_19185/g.34738 Transcript_19185/m.34738 type:complete len:88 (+) Transcript_19185:2141-2404(+)
MCNPMTWVVFIHAVVDGTSERTGRGGAAELALCTPCCRVVKVLFTLLGDVVSIPVGVNALAHKIITSVPHPVNDWAQIVGYTALARR